MYCTVMSRIEGLLTDVFYDYIIGENMQIVLGSCTYFKISLHYANDQQVEKKDRELSLVLHQIEH